MQQHWFVPFVELNKELCELEDCLEKVHMLSDEEISYIACAEAMRVVELQEDEWKVVESAEEKVNLSIDREYNAK